ncbi:MAG: alpha-ketoacid dehydrogenase subunit beta [Dehalococcoidia bacterium]
MPERTMLEAIRETLRAELRRDPSVVVLGEDVARKGGVFGVTEGFLDEFGPLRILDTPVAEVAVAGMAIGAAMAGLRPVAEFQFADYIHPGYDQIVNEAATIRWRSVGEWGCPVVFRAPCGAGVFGGLYHSQSVEALFGNVPGLKIVLPATARDAAGLLLAAIRDDDPVLFFEHKRSYRRYREEVPDDPEPIPLGVARIDRPGDTISLVTYGVGVHWGREAADALAGEGISVEIVDLRTLKPLDHPAIARTVEKTGKLAILHEANRTLGFGAEIAAFAAEELFDTLDAPIVRIAADDCHLPYTGEEERAIVPQPGQIVEKLRRLARY